MPVPAEHIVTSRDGTRIAFECHGTGQPVIIVDGALCRRGLGPNRSLATQLAARFTVTTYDRRGRGASSDTPPYSVEREVEDLAALIGALGGAASLIGMSSGAVLALEAAARLPGVPRLALFEPPLILDEGGPTTERPWSRIGDALASHDRDLALREFLRMVGVPGIVVGVMRLLPLWSRLRAMADTLGYDGALLEGLQRGKPLAAGRWASVTAPTLVITGSTSADWMRRGNDALWRRLPNARGRLLEGQGHDVRPRALAKVLHEFLDPGEGRE